MMSYRSSSQAGASKRRRPTWENCSTGWTLIAMGRSRSRTCGRQQARTSAPWSSSTSDRTWSQASRSPASTTSAGRTTTSTPSHSTARSTRTYSGMFVLKSSPRLPNQLWMISGTSWSVILWEVTMKWLWVDYVTLLSSTLAQRSC